MNIPEELRYTKSHEWLKEEDGVCTVGLTDFAQHALGDIVFVNLPQEGDPVTAGEALGDVESVKAVSDVLSPVSGVVKAVNEELLDNPALVNEAPYGAWLIQVEQMTDEEELLDAAAYEAHCAAATAYSIGKAYKLPTMIGAGVMWNHNNQWKVGFDYSLQKWGSLGYPSFDGTNYALKNGIYKDRSKFNLGAQYCYGERSRAFFKRVQYRVGASYATPYYKMNGVDGPKEISVSAGFGIPIMNSYNNRSMLNISGQWVKSSAKDLIKENSFRINIGFTFNEDWFKKWKMD